MSRPIIIVPTYNESENIKALLGAIRKCVPEAAVLVVDDNSPDGTQTIVETIQKTDPLIYMLRRPGKAGLGVAYIAGFGWAIEGGYDPIVQMDADFSHDPKYLPAMLEALKTHDIVAGSRYIKGGSVSGWGWLRQLISRGGNVYAQTVLGLRASDLTGGFNGWRAATLKKINYSTVASKGYAFQVEMKFRAIRLGATFKEIPIHFANRVQGTSKMSSGIVREAAWRVLKLRQQKMAR